MRTCIVFLLSAAVMCQTKAIDLDKDNKATEAKNSPIVVKDAQKTGKTEKRAPVVMTANPGEVKYESDYKYLPEYRYSPEVNYLAADVKQLYASQQPIAAPKPQFYIYPSSPAVSPTVQQHQTTFPISHIPQPAQMVLMFAVPHPSGQFLMLLPATSQNFIYPPTQYHQQPMYYKPTVTAAAVVPPTAPGISASSHQLYHQQQQQQLPSTNVYQSSYSPPGLAQAAGYVAQQQLSYSGPYRSEKYSKQ